MERIRVRFSHLVVACGLAACLGASPATPSFVAVEATIARVRAEWTKAGAATEPNAPGWNAFFDSLKGELTGYATAANRGDRLRSLNKVYQMSAGLPAAGWAPAAELRDELREWLRPRVTLAWAEERLLQSIKGLPSTADASKRENRERWLKYVGEDLGKALRDYEASKDVRQRAKALGRLEERLAALRANNTAAPWGPSRDLEAALLDLYDRPNLEATVDASVLAGKLGRQIVTTGPVYRKGETSYVTAGQYLGFGLMECNDGLAFYNRQALTSVTPISNFARQMAQDPRGQRIAKLYQFSATSSDSSVVTAIGILRATGLELVQNSTHATDLAIQSVPTQGHGLGRAFLGLLGMNQRKLNQKVYEGAIADVRQGVVRGSREESAERSAAAAAEQNTMLRQFLIGNNTLALGSLAIADLAMRSRPTDAAISGKVSWQGVERHFGADLPKPARFATADPGVSLDVHLASILTNVSRGYLTSDEAKSLENLMVVSRKIPAGAAPAEGLILKQNVDFQTFADEVDKTKQAEDGRVMAVRLKRPGRLPEFSVSRDGKLVMLLHDFSLEVPGPGQGGKGLLAGPSGRIYRIDAPDAEFTISYQTVTSPRPASGQRPVKISGRIENFDPGPNAKVFVINDDEAKPTQLSVVYGTVVLTGFSALIKGQPIDVPLSAIQIPGFAVQSVSPLDPSGWLRVVLAPAPAMEASAAVARSTPAHPREEDEFVAPTAVSDAKDEAKRPIK